MLILKGFIFILITFGLAMVISMLVAAMIKGIGSAVQRKNKPKA